MPVIRSINKLEHNIESDQHGYVFHLPWQHECDIISVLFCRLINVE